MIVKSVNFDTKQPLKVFRKSGKYHNLSIGNLSFFKINFSVFQFFRFPFFTFHFFSFPVLGMQKVVIMMTCQKGGVFDVRKKLNTKGPDLCISHMRLDSSSSSLLVCIFKVSSICWNSPKVVFDMFLWSFTVSLHGWLCWWWWSFGYLCKKVKLTSFYEDWWHDFKHVCLIAWPTPSFHWQLLGATRPMGTMCVSLPSSAMRLPKGLLHQWDT